MAIDQAKTTSDAGDSAVKPRQTRLEKLLRELDRRLKQPHAFDMFAKDSINFGVLATYRQTWEPQSYQVGDLVTTIPLAPKEVRRYTTRQVDRKSRAVKELEDNLRNQRTDSSDTGRAESEIVERAQKKSNFEVSADESFGKEGLYNIKLEQSAGGSQDKESRNTKRAFRESVLKSAQEYRQQHRMEVDTTTSSEFEQTTFQEIQNPNDELAVTYLFYELQRTYQLTERLHQLTPVVLVANEVPAPDQIDDAWLVSHDWMLRRVILDDSFRPALDYLTRSFVGAEVNIAILESNAQAQRRIVEALGEQVRAQTAVLSADEQDLLAAVRDVSSSQERQGLIDIVKGIFDPLGIAGTSDTQAVEAAQTIVDYARESRDRADREKARLLERLALAVTALQAAVDALSRAVREHYDNVAAVDRLRVHVKDNILYYMQAIWSFEPTDQRFFRLYDIEVPVLEVDGDTQIAVRSAGGTLVDQLLGREVASAELPIPDPQIRRRRLADVADLDEVVGFKGNYMIFALKENNLLTLHMMQDYLDLGDELVLRDPDEFSELTVDQLVELARRLHKTKPSAFEKLQHAIRDALIEKLSSPRTDSELVVVPTTSIYVEALVGTHPLLEDFKLIHRAMDAKRVQAQVRHAELENLRLAARAFTGNTEDPDIEKKIVVQSDGVPISVTDNG